MKKLILLFIAFSIAITSFAQNEKVIKRQDSDIKAKAPHVIKVLYR